MGSIEFFSVASILLSSFKLKSQMSLVLLMALISLVMLVTPMSFLLPLAGLGEWNDSLSLFMKFLSIWAMWVACLSLNPTMPLYSPLFLTMALLVMILLKAFSCNSLLWFYLLFEASLIPIFIIILGWGYQPERVQAGLSLLFYTITSSMPLLGMILWMKQSGSISLLSKLPLVMSNSPLNFSIVWAIQASLSAAFLVKLPLFSVHQWLPKAHVEAPVFGSMILASILLKLGGYGVARVFCISGNLSSFTNFMVSFSLVGGGIVSFLCLRQMDMKILIAYSSVAHMALVISSLMTNSPAGLSAALGIMLAHGVVSSGLFFSANILYTRFFTRNVALGKGALTLLPLFTLFWFALAMGNMGTPPTLNFFSEVRSLITLTSWSLQTFIPLFGLTTLSVAFSLILYANSQQGLSSKPSPTLPLSTVELNSMFFHTLLSFVSVLVFTQIF